MQIVLYSNYRANSIDSVKQKKKLKNHYYYQKKAECKGITLGKEDWHFLNHLHVK